jgi:uncharacterized protein YhhL (DUF1145 family)
MSVVAALPSRVSRGQSMNRIFLEIRNRINLFKNLNILAFCLKKVFALNGESLSPKLKFFLFGIFHLDLLQQYFAAVLVSTVRPIEMVLDMMTEYIIF